MDMVLGVYFMRIGRGGKVILFECRRWEFGEFVVFKCMCFKKMWKWSMVILIFVRKYGLMDLVSCFFFCG